MTHIRCLTDQRPRHNHARVRPGDARTLDYQQWRREGRVRATHPACLRPRVVCVG